MGAPTKTSCAAKRVLSWTQGTSQEWDETNLGPCTDELQTQPYSQDLLRPKVPDVVVILANADATRTCTACREVFTSMLQLPSMWWSGYARRSNGHFGCEGKTLPGPKQGQKRQTVVSWARFLIKYLQTEDKYDWQKLNAIVHWTTTGDDDTKTTIVIFDAKERLRSWIMPSLEAFVKSVADPSAFRDPFWSYEGLLEGLVGLHDEAVWRLRTLLRNMEKSRSSSDSSGPDFPRMHELARHAIHMSETLDVAVQVMTGMLGQHESLAKCLVADAGAAIGPFATRNRLLFYQNLIDNLRHRSTSNQQRVQNEIQLAFNMVAQRDNSMALELTHAMRVDSMAMKTIAQLTLIFLPATFIAAIFSTSFFGILDDGTWVMSHNFWMYWAFAVPLTLLAYGLWTYKNKESARKVPVRTSTGLSGNLVVS